MPTPSQLLLPACSHLGLPESLRPGSCRLVSPSIHQGLQLQGIGQLRQQGQQEGDGCMALQLQQLGQQRLQPLWEGQGLVCQEPAPAREWLCWGMPEQEDGRQGRIEGRTR